MLRIAVLGGLAVVVDGEPVTLTPANAKTLIRLLLAKGKAVRADTIYRDVWALHASAAVDDVHKAKVQRQVFELRGKLDPDHLGDRSRVLVTERVPALAYRLVVPREHVDAWAAEDLVDAAHGAEPATAVAVLRRALEMWRDEALKDVRDRPFAESARRRLDALRVTAQHRLLDALNAVGLPDEARTLAKQILEERPEDQVACTVVDESVSRSERVLLSYDLGQPRVSVVLAVGDLFSRARADLVVGFQDTFDTSIRDDLLVYRHTIQGQLLTRLYQGDRRRLDRDLAKALAGVPPVARETRADKRLGNLVRYPLGTVAKIEDPHGVPRCIFCVAYSRISNDYICQSSPEILKLGLNRLWEAVHRFGQFGELAIPLVGSGRSRIGSLTYQELLAMLASSFVTASRQFAVCRELRIILAPEQAQKIDVSAFETHLKKQRSGS